MNRKPKTPAEVLRFQEGCPKQLKAIEQAGVELSQLIARCSDAMADYEFALRCILKSKDKKAATLAKVTLNKHRIK
jgi:hypothetical protein